MKKLYLLLLAMLLSGCSLLDVLNEPAVDLNDDSVTAEFTPSAETMNYHYHQLDEEGQQAYGLLLSGLEEMNSEIELGKIDGQTLETAFVAVMKDNPALFHVQNDYTYEEYSDGSITMKPQYYFDAQEKADIQRQIDERTQEIHDDLQSGTEEAASYLYTYVAEHAEYESGPQDQSMVSFFLDGRTVCAGYSKAYQYLMEKAGIPCTTLSGHLLAATGSGQNKDSSHAWNMIKMEDDWFYVDATSGDVVQYGPHTCYQFFLMSSQEIEQLYQSSVPLMETKDPSQSYFRKNDLYLRHYDEDTVQNAIDRMKKNGEKVLELRTEPFATQQLKEELLSDNRIFELLRKNEIAVEQLGCAQLDELGSIEFYYN